jgi:microcin C transport system substrate-binding protein
MYLWIGRAATVVLALAATISATEAAPVHGVAMHGEPAYPPDFTHFSYVNPDAPKGGSLVMAAIGSFDNLNPYIVRGTPASGVGLVFETLTSQSND